MIEILLVIAVMLFVALISATLFVLGMLRFVLELLGLGKKK